MCHLTGNEGFSDCAAGGEPARGRPGSAPVLTAQFGLAPFLDRRPSDVVAIEGDVEAFRGSWPRPKWPGAAAKSP
jgi:hypothetical protein